ncbi:MAG: hypothetical protein ACOX41_06515 [Anaerovoracaceae bacterium]|jgi:ABC-2 type transport system permease protein
MNRAISSEQTLFRHDLRQVLRRHLGLLIVGAAAFLILIPFATACLPGDSIFQVETTHAQLRFRLISERFVIPVYCCTIFFAAAAGLSLFGFLLKKRETTFYFSVGLTRGKLMLSRFLVGILSLVLVTYMPMFVSLLVNRIALGSYTEGIFANCLFCSTGLFLQGLIVFLCSVIACMLAGTGAEAFLFDLLFLGGPTALLYCCDRLTVRMLWGSPYGAVNYSGTTTIAAGLMKRFAAGNPLLFFYHDLKKYSVFWRALGRDRADDFSPLILLGWALAAVVLAALAYLAMRRRHAEQAELSGQNRVPLLVLFLLSGFCVFSVVFVLFVNNSTAVAALLSVLAVILLMLLWNLGLIRTGVRWPQRLMRVLAESALVVGVVAVFVLAGNGIIGRLPAENEISSVQMTYTGTPALAASNATGSSTGTAYYLESQNRYRRRADVRTVRSINADLVHMGRAKMRMSKEDFGRTVVPYDVQFTYVLKDGRIVKRYYDRASLSILEKMTGMDDSPAIRARQQSLLKGNLDGSEVNWTQEAYQSGTIYLSNTWLDNPYQLNLSGKSRQELLQALAEDVSAQSIEDRYFPDEDAVGLLFFTLEGEDDLTTFSWHVGCAPVFLTREYRHTLAFLSKHHFRRCLQQNEQVEGVYLQEYNPYSGINGRATPLSNIFLLYQGDSTNDFLVQTDFGKKQMITNPRRLRKIVPNLRSTYCMTREGCLAAVKLEGYDMYVYKYLPGSLSDYQ